MTFSIVAYDPKEDTWGVAVASKFLAAAAVVSWAQSGSGAVATQALAKVGYGPSGLKMMSEGLSASETLETLLAADDDREDRQVGLVDASGGAAAHTGANCYDWAGHVVGEGYTCQGNILTGKETVDAMAATFESTRGDFTTRLYAALLAGDTIGGDKRGKQSAGLLIVKPNSGYGGDNDRLLDLRVDDDPNPVKRLGELVEMHALFFGQSKPQDQLHITNDIATQLQQVMIRGGYIEGEADGTWDELSKQAFWELVGNENLEERWNIQGDANKIDRAALNYLLNRFGDSD